MPIRPTPARPQAAKPRTTPSPARARSRPAAPLCDHLEPRQLLAAVSWDGGGGDNLWTNPLNWSTNTVPGAADDVTIDVAGTPQIRLPFNAQSINSLTLRESLTVEGGSLTTATGALVDTGGLVRMQGGTISGFWTSLLAPITTTSSGGNLTNATITGEVLLNTTSTFLTLRGTTTFTALRMTVGGTSVAIEAGYTLSSPIIAEGAASGDRTVHISWGGGVITTISAAGSITASPGLGGNLTISDNFTGTLVNNGTITLNAPGRILAFNVNALTNNGTINATAGTVNLNGTYTSSGMITAGAGATLNLGGTFNATAGIGMFSTSAGMVNVTGAVTNTGNTIGLTDTTGPWRLAGGSITGGSLTQAGAGVLMPTAIGGMLSSVTITGDVVLNTTSAFLTLGGTTSFTALRLAAGGTRVDLVSGYTLISPIIAEGAAIGGRIVRIAPTSSGNATIAPSGSITASTSLAGNLTISDNFAGTLINNGTITLNAPGRTLSVNTSVLTNTGVIQALAGNATISANTYTNVFSGTLTGGTWRFRGTSLSLSQFPAVSTLAATVEFSGMLVPAAFNGLTTITAAGSYTVAGGSDQTIVPAGGTFTNNGTIETGLGSRITLAGNYVQTTTGTYRVQLAGGNPSTDYGVLAITGAATVAGRFDAIAVNGYVPAGGQIQDVLTAANGQTGTFSSVNFPSVVNPEWQSAFLYTGQGIRLIHTSIIDVDLSGEVDLTDFFQFFNWFDATDINADLDNSGEVDLNDYFLFFNLWSQE